jgi:hypothetical protein
MAMNSCYEVHRYTTLLGKMDWKVHLWYPGILCICVSYIQISSSGIIQIKNIVFHYYVCSMHFLQMYQIIKRGR